MRIDVALLLLRLSGALLALLHGWSKVYRLATGDYGFARTVANLGFPLPEAFAWAAALTELVGGLCVALGFGTRVAAGLAAFTMAVAAFARHRAHLHLLSGIGVRPVAGETLSAWGNPELALVYLLVFVALALLGGGRFALDRKLSVRWK